MQPLFTSQSPARPVAARTYQVQTDTSTSVREQTVSNSITTTLRQTHQGRTRSGAEAVLVEVLDFQQTDQSPLAILLADLNPVIHVTKWVAHR